MSEDPNVSHAKPVRGDGPEGLEASTEAAGAKRKRRIVDSDVRLNVYGLEDADGTLGVSDQRIRDALHGYAIYIDGYKFVLILDDLIDEQPYERFFFEDELYHE